MPFDASIPANATLAASGPIRENFVQLATHHIGPTAPPSPQSGYIWLDTSDSGNHILKSYDDSSWRSMLEHLESTPSPLVGQPYMEKGIASRDISSPPAAEIVGVFEMFFATAVKLRRDSSILSSDIIGGETDLVLVDPFSLIVSWGFQTDGNGNRQVVANHNGGIPSKTADLFWKWNGVPFSLHLVSI